MFNRKQNVGSVEPRSVFLEPPDLGEVEKELAAWAVVQNKEELGLRLKCEVHLYDKGMPDVLLLELDGCRAYQDAALGHGVLYLVTARNLSFL